MSDDSVTSPWDRILPRARGEEWRRVTGRVIPVDAHGRCLLMHGFEPDRPDWHFWFTIGGQVEADETTRQAAARELREEVGISVPEGSLGEPVAREQISFTWAGRLVIQDQDIYAISLPPDIEPDLSCLQGAEAATVERCGWVDPEDLASRVEEPVAEELVDYCRAAVTAVLGESTADAR